MKNKIVYLISVLTGCVVLIQPASAQETEPVANVWACSFKPGKDMADLEVWRDFYREQLDTLESEDARAITAFMWTPRFAGANVDLVWFEYDDNLNAHARSVQAFFASGIAPSVDGMWESIVDCESSQSFRRQIYAGSNFSVTSPVVIESFRCNFKPGMGFEQVEELLPRWVSVNERLPRGDEFASFMFIPFHTSGEYDVSYYGVYDSMIDYGEMSTYYFTSSEAQAVDARWREIERCESRLWTGRQMM